jgi:hypothetical protein
MMFARTKKIMFLSVYLTIISEDGTRAEMVSEEGRGVASISSMLTITR